MAASGRQAGRGAALPAVACICSHCAAQVKSLVLSPDPHERLAGVLAIDELAQTKVGGRSRVAQLGEWGSGASC